MKKIKVVCNPVEAPVAFPAEVKYFYVLEGSGSGSTTIDRKVAEWAEKNKKVVIGIESELVIDAAKDAIPGDML